MPNVNIRELDNTGSEAITYDDYAVVIPGLINKGRTSGEDAHYYWPSVSGEGETIEDFKAVRFDNLSKFKECFPALEIQEGGETAPTYGYSYDMACALLKLGLVVIYKPAGGYNDPDDISNLREDFFNEFADKGLYDIRFITTGQFRADYTAPAASDSDNATYCPAAIVAATRGDCVAVIDIPTENAGSVATIQAYLHNLNLGTVIHTDSMGKTEEEAVSKYVAAFAPECTCTIEADGQKLTGAFAYLAAFAKQIKTTPEWFATAGAVRGTIPFNNVVTTAAFGDSAIAALQPRKAGLTDQGDKAWKNSCNVICNIRPYGNIIWGNRTAYAPTTNEMTIYGEGLRAGHFLNIRQLCCTIKKTLYRAARKFTFEPNSDTLWANFCAEIRPTLEKMRTGQGIRGYKIIRENTSQKAVLRATIKIVPIEAVEDFDLTVEMTDSIEVTE